MVVSRFLVAGLSAAVLAGFGCADPSAEQLPPPAPPRPQPVGVVPPKLPDVGKAAWVEGYPKVTADGIAVFGSFTPNTGWAVKDAHVTYAPKAGGTVSKPIPLAVISDKWGAKTVDGKGGPATLPLPDRDVKGNPNGDPKGEWEVAVTLIFERNGPNGQPMRIPYRPALRFIEVK